MIILTEFHQAMWQDSKLVEGDRCHFHNELPRGMCEAYAERTMGLQVPWWTQGYRVPGIKCRWTRLPGSIQQPPEVGKLCSVPPGSGLALWSSHLPLPPSSLLPTPWPPVSFLHPADPTSPRVDFSWSPPPGTSSIKDTTTVTFSFLCAGVQPSTHPAVAVPQSYCPAALVRFPEKQDQWDSGWIEDR